MKALDLYHEVHFPLHISLLMGSRRAERGGDAGSRRIHLMCKDPTDPMMMEKVVWVDFLERLTNGSQDSKPHRSSEMHTA